MGRGRRFKVRSKGKEKGCAGRGFVQGEEKEKAKRKEDRGKEEKMKGKERKRKRMPGAYRQVSTLQLHL